MNTVLIDVLTNFHSEKNISLNTMQINKGTTYITNYISNNMPKNMIWCELIKTD